jgi:nucleotide-binding universal stress UspA family protein
MVSRLVVPLDGSPRAERALPHVRLVAERAGLPVVLLGAISPSGRPEVGSVLDYLEARADALALDGVETRIVESPAAEAIANEAAQEGSLVWMATHGRGGLGQAVLGSVAEEVVRRSDHPVMLVGSHADSHERAVPDRLLVLCLDGSKQAEVMIDEGIAWARLLGLRIFVAEVFPPEPARPAVPGEPPPEAHYVRRVAERISAAGIAVDWDVLHDDHPADAIVRYADESDAAYVAMATHGRGGLARLTAGSVAMSVVHHSPCPVLVRRPHLLDASV